jgi:hypothetical protein
MFLRPLIRGNIGNKFDMFPLKHAAWKLWKQPHLLCIDYTRFEARMQDLTYRLWDSQIEMVGTGVITKL